MTTRAVIKFHDVNEVPYGALSMLSPHPITVRHVTYPSVHHFFLCERFKGTGVEDEIRTATSLWEVDRQVRRGEANGLQRDDWDRVKADVMLLATYYKFKQNPDACAVLTQTGQRPLVDHTPSDSYWGDGADGKGKNLLGVILMSVRKRLSHEDSKVRKGTDRRTRR
jgi:N-glycosidase YbiA